MVLSEGCKVATTVWTVLLPVAVHAPAVSVCQNESLSAVCVEQPQRGPITDWHVGNLTAVVIELVSDTALLEG